jgi:cold shock CspA family protein
MSVTDEISSSIINNRLTGRVKWFNNKTGFGFITALEGEHKDGDVFVHHSTIKVAQDQYRYLVLGEYVEFELSKIVDSSNKHEFQAANVTGVKGGKLICETRWENRAASASGTDVSASADASAGASASAESRGKRDEKTSRSSKPTKDWTTISNERKPFAPNQSTGAGKEWRRDDDGASGRGRGGRGGRGSDRGGRGSDRGGRGSDRGGRGEEAVA